MCGRYSSCCQRESRLLCHKTRHKRHFWPLPRRARAAAILRLFARFGPPIHVLFRFAQPLTFMIDVPKFKWVIAFFDPHWHTPHLGLQPKKASRTRRLEAPVGHPDRAGRRLLGACSFFFRSSLIYLFIFYLFIYKCRDSPMTSVAWLSSVSTMRPRLCEAKGYRTSLWSEPGPELESEPGPKPKPVR